MSLTLEYPYWFIILCLGLGVVYAFLLYYKTNYIQEPTKAQKQGFLGLAFLRFVVVSVLAFLLLSPFIKTLTTETKKPIVLLLQDGSSSIQRSWASTEDSVTYASSIQQMKRNMSEKFDVQEYALGSELRSEWDGQYNAKLSDISGGLSQLIDLYTNQNVAAAVLATDGIYNQGSNPLYTAGQAKFPVHTIALGDTTVKKDIKIDQAYFNRIVYLGDRFKIEAEVVADNYPNVKSKLSLWDYTDGNNVKKLNEQEVTFDKATNLYEFVLNADKKGLRHFVLQLSPVSDEYTRINNRKDIFIDVLDGRQKVLIAAHAPHPDITALKQAAESNKNYEVVITYADKLNDISPDAFDLVIMHQLPSRRYAVKSFIEKAKQEQTPLWYITGSQSNYNTLDEIQSVVSIKARSGNANQVAAVVDPDFSNYTLDESVSGKLPKFPPLASPFGDITLSSTAKVLLKQRIGSVTTDYPLLAFDSELGNRTSVLLGEGIWRWRLYDYLQNNDHETFNELITKTIQYLAVKEDKRQFRVTLTKNVFNESEVIDLKAELYNDAYELVNEPEVSLTVKDAEGKEFPYQFNKRGNGYVLQLANFPVGSYTYSATTTLAGKTYNASGKFTITALQLEASNGQADHQLLYQISERTAGKLFYPSKLDELAQLLVGDDTLKATLIDNYKTKPLLDLKWIFALLISFLSLEWFIRKYQGGY